MIRFCFIAIFALASCRTVQIVNFTTISLETKGPVAIDVSSFSGDVTVIVDPEMQGTVVYAKQRELGHGSVPIPVMYMECSTFIESGPGGEIVHVIATCEDDPLHTIEADITIRAHAIHGVTIVTRAGDVNVLGISGSVDIRTSDGDVRVVTPLVMNDRVSIENRRGNIVYRVRGESSGIIDATAMNGKASLDLRYGVATILPGSTGDHLVAHFNNGLNPIVMRTVDGDVRIFVVADPVGSEPWFDTDWLTW